MTRVPQRVFANSHVYFVEYYEFARDLIDRVRVICIIIFLRGGRARAVGPQTLTLTFVSCANIRSLCIYNHCIGSHE